jgi:C1A family cysteine protease
MKSIIILLIAAVVCSEAVLTFEQWTVEHKKVYETKEEYEVRKQIFHINEIKINKLNQVSKGEPVFGHNRFSDMSSDEWHNTYLRSIDRSAFESLPKYQMKNPVKDIPDTWDWRDHAAVTPVKDQGQCGSCWAFSAVACMEGQHALATGELVSLSEQNVIDCYKNDSGCDGGIMYQAMDYVIKNGGIDTEASYPYEAEVGSCRYNPSNSAANFSSYEVLEEDEEFIRNVLYTEGPVSIGVDASWWQFYLFGIWNIAPCSNNPDKLDHGVTLVGYSVDGSKPYWIIKNSWGSGWGESGYIRVIRGKNKCGIDDMASMVHV